MRERERGREREKRERERASEREREREREKEREGGKNSFAITRCLLVGLVEVVQPLFASCSCTDVSKLVRC